MFEMPVEDEEEVEEIVYFLWDTNLVMYNIFQHIMPFLGEYYSLAPTTTLLIELAKEEDIKVSKASFLIARIHNEFASIVLKPRKEE